MCGECAPKSAALFSCWYSVLFWAAGWIGWLHSPKKREKKDTFSNTSCRTFAGGLVHFLGSSHMFSCAIHSTEAQSLQAAPRCKGDGSGFPLMCNTTPIVIIKRVNNQLDTYFFFFIQFPMKCKNRVYSCDGDVVQCIFFLVMFGF